MRLVRIFAAILLHSHPYPPAWPCQLREEVPAKSCTDFFCPSIMILLKTYAVVAELADAPA